MKIYIDILLFQYLIINYFLIELSGIILHEKMKLKNKLIAALIVSVYSILVLIFDLRIAGSFFGKIILSMIIVLIAFNPQNVSDIFKKIMVLCIVTYLLGGILLSIISQVKHNQLSLLLAFLLCYFIVMFIRNVLLKLINTEKYICNIKIKLNERILIAKALIDSGHTLKDTITGDDVVIINEYKIKELSNELYIALKMPIGEVPKEYQTKIRMISYSSLGNTNDVLMGFRPDSVTIYYDGKEIENNSVTIAMCENTFSYFDAIINLDLIEGGNIIGNSFIVKNEGKKIME